MLPTVLRVSVSLMMMSNGFPKRSMRPLGGMFTALVAVGWVGACAADVIYDGALNTTPDQQGWTLGLLPSPGASIRTAAAGVMTLDTTPNMADHVGYGIVAPAIPVLDRSAGFTLSYTLQVNQETHASPHRSGFSVLAISSDKLGIELGYWETAIWAQNIGFTHGEESAFNTTAGLVRYDLTCLGSSYTLRADGNLLLSGLLRDYSAFGIPYSVPNSVGLADDTSSASARVALRSVSVQTIPEPSVVALVGLGLVGLAIVRRRG